MKQYGWLFVCWLVLSCGDKKPSLADNKPVEAADFFAAFSKLKLPYEAADTSLIHAADTTAISQNVLRQFIPDSAIVLPEMFKRKTPVFFPVGRIENKDELYLLLIARSGNNASLFAYLFSNEKNKKEYLSHLFLLSNNNRGDYTHSISINTEPTFTIIREKTANDQYLYTRHGYAYNNASHSFIEVMNETNENKKENSDILNPIDTLTTTFKYSGDYAKDRTNFISVRDGNLAGRYTFFLHFEKSGGDCSGELKGTLAMVDATKAVFQQSGDPCVIDFTFSGNSIKVKERGSCGNHRGITCFFDDSYKKKKSSNPHSLKGSLK